jgi:CheY-like chemotaxis protein
VPFTPPKPIAPTPEDLRGSTVLVVDDERAWRVILETDLRMLGYKVSMAEDADQALEKAQSDQPEVAIIDLMLPEPMDGWGLLNELRARGQKVPVIFYTAYPVFPSGTDDPDVVGYMSKAIDRADLYALLPPAIRRSRGRRNSDSLAVTNPTRRIRRSSSRPPRAPRWRRFPVQRPLSGPSFPKSCPCYPFDFPTNARTESEYALAHSY